VSATARVSATAAASAHAAEITAKLAQVRDLLASRGWPGVVLTHPGSLAWLTGGLEDPIERGAATGLAWALVTPQRATIVTTTVELPRLAVEWPLDALGLDAVAVAWSTPDGLTPAAEQAAGAPRAALAADGHPDFGVDAADALTVLRLTLTPAEQERLRALAADTARGVETAVAAWRPGDRDRDLSAAIAANLEAAGVFPACLLVGGDDRVERFRHPVAIGAPMRRHAMAVAVGARGGLHVALTRFAAAQAPSPELAAAHRDAHVVEAAMLAACAPQATYGDVLTAGRAAYAQVGEPEAWRDHYQGGPVGYRQREFEIAPDQHDSPWFATPVAAGHAIAFNPSVRGGGKAEDTFLVTASGLECLTDTGAWPVAPPAPGLLPRPQILDLSKGETLNDDSGRRRV
jgi:Xaa-Pro dipeptidase